MSEYDISMNEECIAMLSESNLQGNIQQLRVRPDLESFDVDIWQEAFQKLRVSIKQCTIEPPSSSEGKINAKVWADAFKAAKLGNTVEVLLDFRDDYAFDINDIMQLNEVKCNQKVEKLRVKFDSDSYNKDIWRQAFQQISFTVEKFLIEAPYTSEGRVDVHAWKRAIVAVSIRNVKKISLSTSDGIALNVDDLLIMNSLNFSEEMPCLSVALHQTEFNVHVWQQAFQQMLISIDRCFIIPQQIKEEFGVKTWIEAAEAADVENVKNVSLKSSKTISLSVDDLIIFNETKFTGEVHQLRIIVGTNSPDNFYQAIQKMKLTADRFLITPPQSSEGVIDAKTWMAMEGYMRNIQTSEVALDSTEEVALNVNDIANLSGCGFPRKFAHLWMELRHRTHPDPVTWQKIFSDMTFNVDCCFIKPPVAETGKIDVKKWADAFKAAKLGNTGQVLLDFKDNFAFDINDIMQLNELKCNQKVEKLRVKFDSDSYNKDIWRQAFQQISFTVAKFLIEAPYTCEEEHAVKAWVEAAKIVGEARSVNDSYMPWGSGSEDVVLSCTEDNPLFLTDIINMTKCFWMAKMETLWIIPDTKTFNWIKWFHIFKDINFRVETCIVKPPSPIQGDNDRDIWLKAATAARRADKVQVEKVLMKPIESFYSVETIDLSVIGIEILTQSKFYGEIREARYQPTENLSGKIQPGWKNAFNSMSFTVRHLLVKNCTSTGKHLETRDIRLWMEAANGINTEKIKKVSLMSEYDISMNEECIAMLSESNLQGNIVNIELKKGEYIWIKKKSSISWRHLGIVARKFQSAYTLECHPPDYRDLRNFVKAHGNIAIGRIVILSGVSCRLIVIDSKKSSDGAADNEKELIVIIAPSYLRSSLRNFASMIKDTGCKHVTIAYDWRSDTFISALAGHQIDTLAVWASPSQLYKTISVIHKCTVEKLYILDDTDKAVFEEAQKHCVVTLLSETEWKDMFSNIKRQGPTGLLTESIFGC